MSKLRWIQGFFRQNWEIKLLALLLAVVTYYAIRGATSYEVEYNVPLHVEADPGVAVLSLDPETVSVRFRGSRDDILKLDQQQLVVRLRVREDNVGGRPRAVPVSPRNVEGAPGVNVVMIDPARVNIAFDREVETTFNVARPATIGFPLLGKVEITYSPQVVTVKGPQARIDELKAEGHDEVSTDPVDVDGRVESFSKRVKVLAPGGAWASSITPEEITVQVNIVKKSDLRNWSALPVLAVRDGAEEGRLVMEPPMADATIEGRAELLENVLPDDVRLFVDCVGLEVGGTYELPVQVHVPGSKELSVTVVPKVVKVTVFSR